MTNRVDELESQVATLQATVDGLTEELVETKERLRLLEESVDVDLTSGTRRVGHESDADAGTDGTPTDPAAASDAAAGADHLTESQAQAASRGRTETAADDANFIDAEGGVPDDGAAGGDGTKTDGTQDDDEATTDDDIIVA